MNAFIFFSIYAEPQFIYEKSLVKKIKESADDAIIFDFDNHSEQMIYAYFNRFINENDEVKVIIEANEEASKGCIPFAETLLRSKEKVKVFLMGSHPIIEKMLGSIQSFRKFDTMEENEIFRIISED